MLTSLSVHFCSTLYPRKSKLSVRASSSLVFVSFRVSPRRVIAFRVQVSCLFGMLPREDHKVVRVVDDLHLKDLSPFGDPPILQEPIHVQVSNQWTYDPTLWSSAGVARAPGQTSIPFLVPLFDWDF